VKARMALIPRPVRTIRLTEAVDRLVRLCGREPCADHSRKYWWIRCEE